MEETKMGAYVLKINPNNVDSVQVALDSNEIIIGWSKAGELIDSNLDWEGFRQVIIKTWPGTLPRSAGSSAGNMWRFIREMQIGDLVVVPRGSNFYVAKVTGPARYEPKFADEDTAFRRTVEWLNKDAPIARELANSALYSRMLARQTLVSASDLLPDIQSVLESGLGGVKATFSDHLTKSLTQTALHLMRTGSMNNIKFEKVVASILKALGAEAVVTPKRLDQGDDVVARFKFLQLTLVAQVKYHTNPKWGTGPEAIDQVIAGMEKHDAPLGWVVTCGEFSDKAKEKADAAVKDGRRIRLIEGEELAKLVVELGIKDV